MAARRNRAASGQNDEIIAYMYANVRGTRPISSKGPAFLVLGSFPSVADLVGHVNRVYGRKGPQCTILQTAKNTFVPLLAPEKTMLEYPVKRAAVHTKALQTLFQSRRQKEKKEFDTARAEKRPGIVNKESRDVQKRLQRLRDIGLDSVPEEKQKDEKDILENSAAGNTTISTATPPTETETATSETTDPETTTPETTTPETTTLETTDPETTTLETTTLETTTENDSNIKTGSTPSEDKKTIVAPLDPRTKLINQNYAVVSIIHDERKSGSMRREKIIEPIVSFLGTFATQKEAEDFARKANSTEVPGAPLFVVQMYSWLFTEDVTFESIPVAYPDQPLLEQVVNNHKVVQEQGEQNFINGDGDEDEPDEGERVDQKTPVLDRKSSTTTSRAVVGEDEKCPPTDNKVSESLDEKVKLEPPSFQRQPSPYISNKQERVEEPNMEKAIANDCILNILKNRVLKKN